MSNSSYRDPLVKAALARGEFMIHPMKHDYVFYLVPKTGTRSVLKYLRDHDLLTGRPDLFSPTPDVVKYSFSIVRNPWDRLLSAWKDKVYKQWADWYPEKCHKWRLPVYAEYKGKSFNYFVRNIDILCDGHVIPQTLLIDLDRVDFVGRFENLQEDFDTICQGVGIPSMELPHKNKTKHKHYTEYYDDETRQIVAEKYAKDIEYFGYKFGE